MNCPDCGTENVSEASFCRGCGGELEPRPERGRRLGLAALVLAAFHMAAMLTVSAAVFGAGPFLSPTVMLLMFSGVTVPTTIVLAVSIARHGIGGGALVERRNAASAVLLVIAILGLM